jgi:ATP-dependent Clp protease adaptor protein ClpS
MSGNQEHRGDEGLAIEEAKPRLKEPSMYKVFLLNDDYTPMEFVVTLLEKLFGMDREKATRIMLQVNSHGKGVCGIYTYEIAETKVAQVCEYAQRHQHPLMCSMEAV